MVIIFNISGIKSINPDPENYGVSEWFPIGMSVTNMNDIEDIIDAEKTGNSNKKGQILSNLSNCY